MKKIGFVNICHLDYIDENTLAMAELAVNGLTARGVNVFALSKPVATVMDARSAGRELIEADVDGVILFLGSWVECSVAIAVVREVEHLPLCLWGFGMFSLAGALQSTGSYVSFAMFRGTMERAGYRFKAVLGLPNEEDALRAVQTFSEAASAAKRLKHTRIGLVGYTSMNIYPGTFDHLYLRVNIGPDVEQMDSYTVIRKAEALPKAEVEAAEEYIKSLAKIREDVSEEALYKSCALFEALRQLCAERQLDAINVKCQYEFSKEYQMVACVPVSALAETGIVSSCEGDMLNTVSMAILHALTGQSVSYGDAMNHTKDNVLKLSSCGFIPFSMGYPEQREIRRFMPHPGFHGIQPSFVLRAGRVTVMRLVEERASYHMLYFTGTGLPTELRQGYMPALDVRLDGSTEELSRHYAGQHFAICYGDCSEQIEDLARILGISTIRV